MAPPRHLIVYGKGECLDAAIDDRELERLCGELGLRPLLRRLKILARLDVFSFDYRGYGQSTGRPTEQGTYRDADAAWVWLTGRRGVECARVVLFDALLHDPGLQRERAAALDAERWLAEQGID